MSAAFLTENGSSAPCRLFIPIRRDRPDEPIWYELQDGLLWLNPASSRAWGRKLEPGVPVTLIMVDPSEQWRWAQIQGEVVEKSAQGAEEHIDRLSQRYLGRDYADHGEDDPRLLVPVGPTRLIQSSIEDDEAA